ncbi:MAG: alpha/beta hydrolase [Actinomycetia bacterium]|nr:alpha/beta hydrolase [Actinomycetes bacterium]
MVNLLGDGGGARKIGPGRLIALAEVMAPFEYATAFAGRRLLPRLPRGDRTVLVLPGFLATDANVWTLRRELRKLGHWVSGWGEGFNLGPSQRVVDSVLERLVALADERQAKVDLVGWSLGGVYARYLAYNRPDLVSSVITMGSPIHPVGERRGAVSKIFDRVAHVDADLGDFDPTMRLKVPVTSIWTRTDGVVDWKAAATRPGPRTENIEVPGTHIGLPVNPFVLHVVADRLGQSDGEWAPYRRQPNLQLPIMRMFADADEAAASVWDDLDDLEDEPDDYVSPLLGLPDAATS